MKLLLLFMLVFWYLPTGVVNVELCGERRRVIGTQGGDVTLPVDYTNTTTVSWVAGHNEKVFAVTKPNCVTIKDDRYEGRLSVAADGSLIMFNVTNHDEGIYEAFIETQPSRQCVQRYHLRIYRKAKPCGESRRVFSVPGDVTLSADYGPKTTITWVEWNRFGETVIAVTEPGKPVLIKDYRYNGRLKAAADGSLIITNVTQFQIGYYEAFIEGQQSMHCVQYYHLFIYGKDKSCGESRRVFSVRGGEVTLPAGYGANTAITWVEWDWYNGTVIAVTEPGKPVLIKYDQYNGRLKAAADGSLIVTDATEFQYGHFGAFIEEQQSMHCVQDYHLIIYDMDTIVYCGEKIAVSGLEGGEVTLPVDEMDITYEVVWVTPSLVQADHGNYANEELNKRLSFTPNGDLVITKLTREDSGFYEMHYSRWKYECLQLYELTVNNYRTINIIRLVFSILLIFLICGIVFEYMKANKTILK